MGLITNQELRSHMSHDVEKKKKKVMSSKIPFPMFPGRTLLSLGLPGTLCRLGTALIILMYTITSSLGPGTYLNRPATVPGVQCMLPKCLCKERRLADFHSAPG